MTATEIMAALRAEESNAILEEMREHDRQNYRAMVTLLATRRRLRAAFLDKKPLTERHQWMAAEMSKKSNADVSTELLQGWLMGCHCAMLRDFLDSIGVQHDGQGLIESLPEEPPQQTLETAIENLAAKYPAQAVFAYLHLFCEMDIAANWPILKQLLTTHPALNRSIPTS